MITKDSRLYKVIKPKEHEPHQLQINNRTKKRQLQYQNNKKLNRTNRTTVFYADISDDT